MTIFVNSIKEEFKADEILQAKNNTPEELEQIMQRETQANNMKFVYNEEKMKEKKKKSKILMIVLNLKVRIIQKQQKKRMN